jgi:hypothetical protein
MPTSSIQFPGLNRVDDTRVVAQQDISALQFCLG